LLLTSGADLDAIGMHGTPLDVYLSSLLLDLRHHNSQHTLLPFFMQVAEAAGHEDAVELLKSRMQGISSQSTKSG